MGHCGITMGITNVSNINFYIQFRVSNLIQFSNMSYLKKWRRLNKEMQAMAESSDEENVAAAYSSHSDKSEEPDISDNVPEEEDISDNIPESEDSADNYSDGSSNYSSDNDSDGSVGQLDLGKDLASWLVKI